MSTTPTLPNMSREQTRELKQLRVASDRITRGLTTSLDRLRGQAAKLEQAITRGTQRRQSAKSPRAKISARVAVNIARRQLKPLRTQIVRITEGRTADHNKLAAITKRIAVLEGRLS